MKSNWFWTCGALLVSVHSGPAYSQERMPSSEIPDVAYVDRGWFLPDVFSETTSGADRDLTVEELVALLREEHQVDVRIDVQSLLDEGGDAGIVGSWFGGVPLYAAIDQFCDSARDVSPGWYLDRDVLVMTTAANAEDRHIPRALDVSGFIDDGVPVESLSRLLDGTVRWVSGDYLGASVLGNVIHLRGTFETLLKSNALIAGLQTPGRIRYLDQTQLNAPLRDALSRRVRLPEGPYPVVHLVEQLEQLFGVDIWIDRVSLSDEGISADEVVHVPGVAIAADQLVDNVRGVTLGLLPKNGRLWLTTAAIAEEQRQGVVYDISDLLSENATYDDFIDVIQNSTAGPWHEGPVSVITEFEESGLLVVWHNERIHREIQSILADQRRLVRIDPPVPQDPTEVLVRGYELHLETAEDVEDLIPQLIATETWRTDEHPERIGLIRVVSLGAKQWAGGGSGSGGGFFSSYDDDGDTTAAQPAHRFGMLVIRQTRAVHHQVRDWLEALHAAEFPDPESAVPIVDLPAE